jgi:hypothetical protein
MDVFGYGGPGDQEKANSLKMIKKTHLASRDGAW